MPGPAGPTPPGWYPDGRGGERWWDGRGWSEHTRPSPQVTSCGFDGAGATASGGSRSRKGPVLAGLGVGALLLAAALAVVLLTVLGGADPEDVADDYLDAQADGDFEETCELWTDESRESHLRGLGVDSCAAYEDGIVDGFEENPVEGYDTLDEYLADFEFDYEVGDVTEDGDTAEADFTRTIAFEGEDEDIAESADEEDEPGTIYLVREDDEWRVDKDASDEL